MFKKKVKHTPIFVNFNVIQIIKQNIIIVASHLIEKEDEILFATFNIF